MEYIIYLILLVGFLLRITPRLILPYAIADDGYSHYEDIDILYKNKLIPPKYYSKTLLKQVFGYPFGLMYLFVLIPRKLHLKLEILISPLCDTLLIYVAYSFFKYYSSVSGYQIDEYYFCLFAAVLATYSVFLRNDSGPRVYHGSSRVISQLFFVCLNYAFYRFYMSGDYLYLGISIVFGFLLILFSIFGTQALFLSSVVIVASGVWTYTLVPLGALLLFYLLLMRKGHQMIIGRLWHYEWYYKFYQRVRLVKWNFLVSPINDYMRNILEWIKLLFKFKWRSLLIYVNIYNNPIHLLIAAYFCYFFIFNQQNLDTKPSYFLAVLSLGCLLAFVSTLFKRMLFLGESYRYLEFGVVFAMILFFSFLYEYKPYSVYGIIVWIMLGLTKYYFYQVEFFSNNSIEHNNYNKHKLLFEKINLLIDGNVYASAYFRTRGAYFGNFKYIALRGLQNIRIESIKSHQLAFGDYPLPDHNYKELISHFDISYWLTTKKEFDAYCKVSTENGDIKSAMDLIYEDSDLQILLFKVNKLKL